MPALLFQNPESGFTTPIPDDFILNHMPAANGNYVKVYLYVFHHYFRAKASCSTKDIAMALGLLESDVLQALQYWHEKRILVLRQDGDQLWLSFTLPSPTPPSGPSGQSSDRSKVVRVERKPGYSPEEIGIYGQNPLIQDLFDYASRLLGEQFSFPNLSLLFSFYDYYRLPIEVIKFMIQHCVENGNRSLRYMEKVAQDWADQGITTVEAAKSYVRRFEVYRPILRALGVSDRKPGQAETEAMDRWLYQYKQSLELILEAAARTLRKTGKPSFKYMDSILRSWSQQQVQTLDDVARADEAFAAQRQAGAANTAASPTPKGAFHTYSRRSDRDYGNLEKQAQDQLYTQRQG